MSTSVGGDVTGELIRWVWKGGGIGYEVRITASKTTVGYAMAPRTCSGHRRAGQQARFPASINSVTSATVARNVSAIRSGDPNRPSSLIGQVAHRKVDTPVPP